MGAERSQWQFPANEVGKVIGWSDEASPSNPSASKGLVNKGPFIAPDSTDASDFGFVIDEDDMASDSDTKVPTQQSVKAYVDSRAVAGDPIFILATGQSNIVTPRTLAWTPAPNLQIWNSANNDVDSVGTAFADPAGTTIRPAESAANEIALANPERAVYLVNIGRSGQAITQWMEGASAPDVYGAIEANIPDALAAAGVSRISALLWWQGETGGSDNDYPTDFETVMDRFKSENWFDDDTPVIIFGIVNSVDGGSVAYQLINGALQLCANAQPSARRFVNTGSLTGATYWADTLHMTALGYWTVGRMAASSFLGRVVGDSTPGLVVNKETGSVAIGGNFTSASFSVNRNTLLNPTASGGNVHLIGADGAAASLFADGYGAPAGGQFVGRLNQGTAASPTAVLNGNILVTLEGRGRHTAGTETSDMSSHRAQIRGVASQNWDTDSQGARWDFYTTPNDSITPALAATIDQDKGFTTYGSFFAGTMSATGATAGKAISAGVAEYRMDSSVTLSSTAHHQRFYNPNGLVGSIATNASATAFNTSSDERLKEGFEDFDAGEIIDAISMYRYAWKVDGSAGYGPKAQELNEVFPLAVSPGSVDDAPGDETFQPWGFDASKLVPLLIKEVQELRKRVATLENS